MSAWDHTSGFWRSHFRPSSVHEADKGVVWMHLGGHFVDSFGNKTGLGETFTCTFYETFTDPDGNLVEVFGTSYKVPV
jgi:hypothetical protein